MAIYWRNMERRIKAVLPFQLKMDLKVDCTFYIYKKTFLWYIKDEQKNKKEKEMENIKTS